MIEIEQLFFPLRQRAEPSRNSRPRRERPCYDGADSARSLPKHSAEVSAIFMAKYQAEAVKHV